MSTSIDWVDRRRCLQACHAWRFSKGSKANFFFLDKKKLKEERGCCTQDPFLFLADLQPQTAGPSSSPLAASCIFFKIPSSSHDERSGRRPKLLLACFDLTSRSSQIGFWPIWPHQASNSKEQPLALWRHLSFFDVN